MYGSSLSQPAVLYEKQAGGRSLRQMPFAASSSQYLSQNPSQKKPVQLPISGLGDSDRSNRSGTGPRQYVGSSSLASLAKGQEIPNAEFAERLNRESLEVQKYRSTITSYRGILDDVMNRLSEKVDALTAIEERLRKGGTMEHMQTLIVEMVFQRLEPFCKDVIEKALCEFANASVLKSKLLEIELELKKTQEQLKEYEVREKKLLDTLCSWRGNFSEPSPIVTEKVCCNVSSGRTLMSSYESTGMLVIFLQFDVV
eukprot:Nk52_evm37s123 gene=Nk52_evmTU37s123